jgi:L-aminopeptidase/D-esterase-like protein
VLVAVATDATLTRIEAGRVAQMAAAGMARSLSPAHTTFDGDIIFVLSLGHARADLNALGIAAAEAVAHAIVRGVTQSHSAHGVPGLAGSPP